MRRAEKMTETITKGKTLRPSKADTFELLQFRNGVRFPLINNTSSDAGRQSDVNSQLIL
jgi:hypothetical protein